MRASPHPTSTVLTRPAVGARLRWWAKPVLSAVMVTVLWTGMTPMASASTGSSTTVSSTTVSRCTPRVINGVIPTWASSGFHPRAYRMHYELGNTGQIVALLWQFPLLSPPSPTVVNKILWVSRSPGNGSPLLISAQRMVGPRTEGGVVRRSVFGGPGPSHINLPAPGCWRLDLEWAGHHDSVDLQYVANHAT